MDGNGGLSKFTEDNSGLNNMFHVGSFGSLQHLALKYISKKASRKQLKLDKTSTTLAEVPLNRRSPETPHL